MKSQSKRRRGPNEINASHQQAMFEEQKMQVKDARIAELEDQLEQASMMMSQMSRAHNSPRSEGSQVSDRGQGDFTNVIKNRSP